MTGITLEIKYLTFEAIVVIPVHKDFNANLQSTWISGPKKTYPFEGKIFAILAPPRSRRTQVSWTGVNGDDSDVTSNVKFVKASTGIIEWQRMSNRRDQTVWAIEHEATNEFQWTMSSGKLCCGNGNSTQCISFDVIHVTPGGVISNINNSTCTTSAVGSMKAEKHSQTLLLLQATSEVGTDSNLQVAWKPVEHNKRIAKGVIVGTKGGLYVIDLNPLQDTKLVSGKEIGRVAFDWNSKKVYWIEEWVGMMRANVDGSDYEQLIADMSLSGLQIEPITGNLYCGRSQKHNPLRVCNNDGKICSTISNTTEYVYGIAFHQTKGLLFWSTYSHIFRANLHGSNATAIVQQGSDGIRVDEREDRLYFSDSKGFRTIMSCDLNGHDVRALTRIPGYPTGLDVDDDKVYFSFYSKRSLH